MSDSGNYIAQDSGYTANYKDYSGLARVLYSNTKSAIKNFNTKNGINKLIKEIIKLYNEDEDSDIKLLGSIYEDLKEFNVGVKFSDTDTTEIIKQKTEDRTIKLTKIANFYSDLNSLLADKYENSVVANPNLRYSYLSATANTILNKIDRYIAGETIQKPATKNGKPSQSKTIVNEMKGDMSNLIKEISEPAAMQKLHQILMSQNLKLSNVNIKLAGENVGIEGLEKESRDIIVKMTPEGKAEMQIGITIKQYSVKNKNNPYVDLKLRDTYFKASVLRYLSGNFSSNHQKGILNSDVTSKIINDLVFAFHYKRYADGYQSLAQQIINGAQQITIALLLDMLYTQGNMAQRGIQLAIINKKAYNILDTLPKDFSDAGKLAKGNDYTQINKGFKIADGVKYQPRMTDGLEYLTRYEGVKLVLRHKFYLNK